MDCKRTFFAAAAIFALLATASGQPVENDPPKSPPLTAKAFVQVVADPKSGLTDRDILVVLGSSESLLAKAIGKVSPEAAKRAGDFHQVEVESYVPSIPGMARMYVSIQSEAGVPADKLLAAWLECLQEKLRDIDVGHQAENERADALTVQVKLVARDLEEQLRAYDALAKKYRMPKNAEIASQKAAQLDLQRQTMAADMEGLHARQKVLEEQLALMGERVMQEAEKDPVVVELATAFEIQKRLAAMRQAAAGRKKEPIEAIQELEAQAELAKYQAELSKFRREAIQSAGGGRMVELKRRLEDTAIEIAETEAKLRAVSKFESEIGSSVQVEQKRSEIESLEREYQAVSAELNVLRRKLRLYQPPQVKLMMSYLEPDVTLPKAPANPQEPVPPYGPPKPAKPPEKPASPAK